jgi:zinc protease
MMKTSNFPLRNFRSVALTVALIFITALAPCAHAQAPALRPTDATTEFATANGLKTIYRPVQGNEVIAVRVYFKGGVRNVSPQQAGLETLLFEVAQQGTKNFSKGQINRELARMGTVIESAGLYDFSLVAMRCVRKHFDRSWQLLTDILLNPTFDEKEFQLAKEQLLSALRQETDDPDSLVASASDKLLYTAHPYFNRPTGNVETVSKLTAADLKTHHAKLLETSRLLLVVVGSVTQDDVKRKAEASFGKLAQGSYSPAPLPDFARAGLAEFQLTERPVQTNYIRATFAAPPLNHPDYPAMSVMMDILQQLFFQEVRVKRNLSYGADTNLLAQGANAGNLTVTTAKPNETLRVMYEQIDFLQKQTIAADPLQGILSGFLTKFYSKLETNDAQAARLAEYELLGGGWRRAGSWIDEINKVTPQDIQRVAKLYLKNFHIAAIGDARQFDQQLFKSR